MTTAERAVLRKKVLTALKRTHTLYGLAVETRATEADVGIVLNELHRAKIIDARGVLGFRVLDVAPRPQPFLADGDW
jgi:hypothetical protein